MGVDLIEGGCKGVCVHVCVCVLVRVRGVPMLCDTHFACKNVLGGSGNEHFLECANCDKR